MAMARIGVAVSVAGLIVGCGSATKESPQKISLATRPSDLAQIAVGEGAVWVRNYSDGAIWRIDPERGKVTAKTVVGPEGCCLAVGEGGVWATVVGPDVVVRLDPRTARPVKRIKVGDYPELLTVAFGSVWVSNHHDGTVSRIDPATSSVVKTVRVSDSGSSGPQAIVGAAGAIWVAVPRDVAVYRIDPSTNKVMAKVATATGGCGSAAGDAHSVWFTGGGCAPYLEHIAPDTNKVVPRLERKNEWGGLAVGFGSAWATTSQGLVRIDMSTNKIAELRRYHGLGEVAVGAGAVWATQYATGNVIRFEP